MLVCIFSLYSCFYSTDVLIAMQTKTTENYMSKILKVSKGAKIRNRYNQVPHLAQDTNGKVTNSQ